MKHLEKGLWHIGDTKFDTKFDTKYDTKYVYKKGPSCMNLAPQNIQRNGICSTPLVASTAQKEKMINEFWLTRVLEGTPG